MGDLLQALIACAAHDMMETAARIFRKFGSTTDQ